MLRLCSLFLILIAPVAAGTIVLDPNGSQYPLFGTSVYNCFSNCHGHESGTFSFTFSGGSGPGSFQLLFHVYGSHYPGGYASASANVSVDSGEGYGAFVGYGSYWSAPVIPMEFGVPVTGTYSVDADASAGAHRGYYAEASASISIVRAFDADGQGIPATVEYSFVSDSAANIPEPATAVTVLLAFGTLLAKRCTRARQ